MNEPELETELETEPEHEPEPARWQEPVSQPASQTFALASHWHFYYDFTRCCYQSVFLFPLPLPFLFFLPR